MRHRILQHGGRRFSIKLETGYWTALEAAAARHGLRLNALIGALARDMVPGIGFTATLRLYCLNEAVERLHAAEREVADLSLAAGATDLASVVAACPAPSLILSQGRTITRVNGAFLDWLGAKAEDILGQPADHFFQIRGHFRLDDLWKRFAEGYTKPVVAKLAYVSPGRVIVAKANLCAAAVNGPEDFSCLVMLESGPAR